MKEATPPLPHVHSVTRALELANPAAAIVETDFTRIPTSTYRIAPESRRLDALARLLRLHTTVCAAVAIHPGPGPDTGRIVIAMNIMGRSKDAAENTAEVQAHAAHIRGLLNALSHIHEDAIASPVSPSVVTDADKRVLCTLFNKKRDYEYLLRIVDGVGEEADFTALRNHYDGVVRHLIDKKRPTADDTEALMHAQECVRLINNIPVRDIGAIIDRELNAAYRKSRYKQFLDDTATYEGTVRIPQDIAKIASSLEDVFALYRDPIIITPNHRHAAAARLEMMDTAKTYRFDGGTVHAEMQVAEYFLSRGLALPPYMGISMHCCRTCSSCMNIVFEGRTTSYRGESPMIFPGVIVPDRVMGRITGAGVDLSQLTPEAVARAAATRPAAPPVPLPTQEHSTSSSEPDRAHRDATARTPVPRHLAIAATARTAAAVRAAGVSSAAAATAPRGKAAAPPPGTMSHGAPAAAGARTSFTARPGGKGAALAPSVRSSGIPAAGVSTTFAAKPAGKGTGAMRPGGGLM